MQGTGFNFGAASTPATPAFGASNPVFGAASAGKPEIGPHIMASLLLTSRDKAWLLPLGAEDNTSMRDTRVVRPTRKAL